jgi:RimJ/RimL family protein N-acetyltransferase
LAADAPDVERYVGERAIAATTLNIPHPYPKGLAEEWISGRRKAFDDGEGVAFAIERSEDGKLVGAISAGIDRAHEHAEIGYWIATPFWGNGYATEAARAVVDYAFEVCGLHRVLAHCFVGNGASARVLEKAGMTREGTLREHALKWDEFVDLHVYAIVRSEWAGARG